MMSRLQALCTGRCSFDCLVTRSKIDPATPMQNNHTCDHQHECLVRLQAVGCKKWQIRRARNVAWPEGSIPPSEGPDGEAGVRGKEIWG